ncbi:protein ImuB [Paramicrobacterium humi]|uniref:Protein ImuB n=1 Tax=Paramicrobacterium humi TaxID=640635 RepID=A0A1H4Q391_9MICO|nr:DNA polymerase Y family protein [Microbacterium humi]SEC14071.1 protein ImuB [Microbacterium humi]
MPESLTRSLVLWCVDWSVMAAADSTGNPRTTPFALVERGLLAFCNRAAAQWGVRAGQRVREAQAACPALVVHGYDADADHRAFENVFARLDELTPGAQVLAPGLCALRMRGPSRYYGGEEAAASRLLSLMRELDIDDARIGVADGIFPAELAARRAEPGRAVIVPAGTSAGFVADVPIDELPATELAGQGPLLHRLGIHTLGQYARLGVDQVRDRFGPAAVRLHRLANGDDPRMVEPTQRAAEFTLHREFDDALDRADQIAFTVRADADRMMAHIAEAGLVATAMRIELRDETGDQRERTWLHPRFFSASDVLDRLRWQLQGAGSTSDALASPIVSVQISAAALDDRAHHEEGLWGDGVDQRVHHSITRVQSMLGHAEVCTISRTGGRMLRERQQLVPWGERAVTAETAAPERPWPGALKGLPPSTVFERPAPVTVFDRDGNIAVVTARGTLHAPLAALSTGGSALRLTAWAGPWPVDMRWWDPANRRRLYRFQAIDQTGTAWLLNLEDGRWSAEGRYD